MNINCSSTQSSFSTKNSLFNAHVCSIRPDVIMCYLFGESEDVCLIRQYLLSPSRVQLMLPAPFQHPERKIVMYITCWCLSASGRVKKVNWWKSGPSFTPCRLLKFEKLRNLSKLKPLSWNPFAFSKTVTRHQKNINKNGKVRRKIREGRIDGDLNWLIDREKRRPFIEIFPDSLFCWKKCGTQKSECGLKLRHQ